MLDLNKIDFNSDEEISDFLNQIQLLDDFQRFYLMRKVMDQQIVKSRIKDKITKNPLFLSYCKSMQSFSIKYKDEINLLRLIEQKDLSCDDMKNFIEGRKIFISNLTLREKIDLFDNGAAIMFESQDQAENFVIKWNQLNELQKILEFMKRAYNYYIDINGYKTSRFVHGSDKIGFYAMISTEFIKINRLKKDESFKIIMDMLMNDFSYEEIESYWIMNKITN